VQPPKQKKVPFFFGGLASCVATVCTHPLDLIKVTCRSSCFVLFC